MDLIVESLLLFIIVFHIYSIIDIWEVIQWLASFHKDMNDKKRENGDLSFSI